MIDYKVAFREGLTAAEKADMARKEIDSVFEQLNHEISEASDGKIVIERQTFYVPDTRNEVIQAFDAITSFPNQPKRPTYLAIAARNPTIPDGPVKELASWSTDRKGYPCNISWEGKTQFCEDKEALEEALAELLRDPIVGQKLYALTKLEPPTEEETNNPAQQDDVADPED